MSTEAEVAKGEEERVTQSAATPRVPSIHTFLDELLAEQQQLQTPAARFSVQHASLVADHSSFHTDLIPLTAPAPGEQYAFEVDLDACSGCKACVAGCHSLNGLDDNETWRDVGLVLGGDAEHPFQQTITSACHHCEDPGCLNGCPVLAYEKDPVTGIVRHLDDQCIGCSYCILKCPYDVPKFSKRLGIVRKCDMCHSRLSAGEAPACVQACPTHAITIVKVTTTIGSSGREASPRPPSTNDRTPPPADASARHPYPNPTFLPVAPDPSYTRPTTRYISKRTLPANLRAADAETLYPQDPHWPLVLMLVLTQASVGALGVHLLVTAPEMLWVSVLTGAAGLAASVLHLGQPTRAWRIFLGLRRSWLSREAVIFGGYFPLLLAALAAPLLPLTAWHFILAPAAFVVGAVAVFCSVMIYVDTHRRFWSLPHSLVRFFGTTTVLGLAAGACLDPRLLPAVVIATVVKLASELNQLRKRRGPAGAPGTKSARLMSGPLRRATAFRFLAATIGGVLLPVGVMLDPSLTFGGTAVGAVALLAAEFAERYLYFRAVDAPKMPGKPA